MSDCGCFPGVDDLAALAGRARRGGPGTPCVGDGSPDTLIGCGHGSWRLGDILPPEGRACSETTRAGDPCKGTPGDDGLCAAHKTASA